MEDRRVRRTLTITGVEKSGNSGAFNCGTNEKRPQMTISNKVKKNTTYGYSANITEYLAKEKIGPLCVQTKIKIGSQELIQLQFEGFSCKSRQKRLILFVVAK